MPPVMKSRLVGVGAAATAVGQAAIAAGNVVVSPNAGRLCKVIVNIAFTSAQAITFYDNATTNSGTIIFTTAAAPTAGTVYDLQIPVVNGITIAANASLLAGAVIVTWE